MGALNLGVHCEATLLPIHTPAYLFLGQQSGNGSRGPGVEAPTLLGKGLQGTASGNDLKVQREETPSTRPAASRGAAQTHPFTSGFFSFIHSFTH